MIPAAWRMRSRQWAGAILTTMQGIPISTAAQMSVNRRWRCYLPGLEAIVRSANGGVN